MHALAAHFFAPLTCVFAATSVWDYLGLTRIYTKRRGQAPDLSEPVVLTHGRHGVTGERA